MKGPPELGEFGLSKVESPAQEGTMQPTKAPYDVTVSGERLVSHAGIGLLAELADRLGLTGRWSGSRSRSPAAHAATRQPGSSATRS
jgi:hypothetical protein